MRPSLKNTKVKPKPETFHIVYNYYINDLLIVVKIKWYNYYNLKQSTKINDGEPKYISPQITPKKLVRVRREKNAMRNTENTRREYMGEVRDKKGKEGYDVIRW